MNNERRKQIKRLIERVEALALSRDSIVEDIEALAAEEEEAHDNMPDSLKGGAVATDMQSAIEALNEAKDSLEQIDVDEAVDALNHAMAGE